MTSPNEHQDGIAETPSRGELLTQGELVAVADIRDALIIKEGSLFLMTDAEGNVPGNNTEGFGLYKGDTRYLSRYELSLNDVKPTVLLSSAELGYGSEHYLANPPLSMPDGKRLPKESLEIRRQRVIKNSLLETIQVTNYNVFPVTVHVGFGFDADFVDIFEVRGEERRRRGRLSEPVVGKDRVLFEYVGLDDVHRRTEIKFSPVPDRIWHHGAEFSISLRHHETVTISVSIAPDDVAVNAFSSEFQVLAASYRDWLASCTHVTTNNNFFNAMLEQSLNDVRMLTVENENGGYVAAGTPWFSSLFGRDSLITSFQMLAFNPEVAKNTLRILAQWQGKKVDDWRDEEPGKILHELRTGEMASLEEIPMAPYYGSVDSTPLFLMLAAEYVSWTADMELIRELEPNLMSALAWIQRHIDLGSSGYLEYTKRSSKGLLNQGWKDSHDGVVNGDGTLVRPPIALAEVQGYVYAAKLAMARLLGLLDKEGLAKKLRKEAVELSASFNRDFWLDDERFFALALGAEQRPATSITSNPAQCLWTGIIDSAKVPAVVQRIFSNDMFSGWGIRTLSSGSPRYNPLGYHLGSVWPHDNSIIGMGLKRSGFEDELNELVTALYDCCRTFDYYRLPELFCGVPRTAHGMPVRYPVACRPQAWAAGTFPMLLQAMLGLAPNASKNELRIVGPRLPHWLDEVEVRGLRVGNSSVDLLFERRRGRIKASVTAGRGVNIVFAKKWPRLASGS